MKNKVYILPLAVWFMTGCASSRYADQGSDQWYSPAEQGEGDGVTMHDPFEPAFSDSRGDSKESRGSRVSRDSRTSQFSSSSDGGEMSNDVTVSQGVKSQSQKNYELLLAQAEQLNNDIDLLGQYLNEGLSRSKAKKVTNQLGVLTAELSSVERKMAAYPRSVVTPGAADANVDATNKAFRDELQERAAQRLAATGGGFSNAANATNATMSSDPEVQRAYDAFQGQDNGAAGTTGGGNRSSNGYSNTLSGRYLAGQANSKVTFCVQVGVGKSGNISSFSGLSGVRELPGPNGTIYYVGQYSSLAQAKAECQRIKQMAKYSDAFVIAIMNQKRITLKQAELYTL